LSLYFYSFKKEYHKKAIMQDAGDPGVDHWIDAAIEDALADESVTELIAT
jgi:hypothetical protein